MITDIKGKAAQLSPVVTGEGDQDYVRMSKLGALYNADWKFQLAAAGLVYSAFAGAMTTGGTETAIVGGGNGTSVDNDQPEFVIGVDAGYYLIPIEANVSVRADQDADGELVSIILYADRTQAPVTTNASGTSVTPTNLLDGSTAFPGRCWSGSTGDITDPVGSELLDYLTAQSSDTGTAASNSMPIFKMSYNPLLPTILAGPCQIVLLWGGTGVATGMGVVKVACVPASYFPVV